MRLVALIQRGFDSTISNWPLLLIRIAGSVAMTMVVLAAIIPVAVAVVYTGTMTDIEMVSTSEGMIEWLLSNAVLIIALILVLTLIIAVAIAIHAFVTGGGAGIYLDADRAAPRERWTRSQLALFSPDSWMRHARRTWWQIFIIYNLTWGIFTILILLPLLAIVPLFLSAGRAPELGVLGCAGVAVWLFAVIVGSVVVHSWTELAVLDTVRAPRARVLAPMRNGISILFSNLGRILVLIILMVLVTLAVGSLAFATQFGLELGMNMGDLALLFLPIQIAFSLLQTFLSVFLSAWLMACFATIVNESGQGVSLATPQGV